MLVTRVDGLELNEAKIRDARCANENSWSKIR